MNCQDISRALDAGDVNALSTAEQRACEAHAASCPHCGPDWIVFTRLAALPVPPMPQRLGTVCEAAAAARLRNISVPRRSSRTVLLGAILMVGAAAAVLVTRLIPPDGVVVRSVAGIGSPPETPPRTSTELNARQVTRLPDGVAVHPVTVHLELIQETDDAMGVTFGQQVYERAREELRALAGVVLVDAREDGNSTPAVRMAYTNSSKSGTEFFLGPDGLPAPAGKQSDELLFAPDLRFAVEGLYSGGDASGSCETRLGEQVIVQPCGGGEAHRIVYLGGRAIPMPADCVGQRTERCRTTPSDIAALTILQWRLWATPPDPALEERLHAMLNVSSVPDLRFMAFNSLVKYKKLRMDAGELRAVADLILTADATLRAELVNASLKVGNAPELMRQARDLLLREKPNGDRAAGFLTRGYLVTLLAQELRNEPDARATLESVADSDPYFEVREQAKRVLSQGEETN